MSHTATAPRTTAPTEPIEPTEDEQDWLVWGPVDGDVPGLVRRVRRILDVSQRGLAEVLGVSQSVVARWETDRTSPRASVLQHLLRLAGITVALRDDWTGEPVEPMRDDGARNRGGSRYPAHVDLRVTGWWVPRELRTMTSVDYLRSRDLSRQLGRPSIRYRACRWTRAIERQIHGTPVDHPSFGQLHAEAEHLEEERQARRERALGARRAA